MVLSCLVLGCFRLVLGLIRWFCRWFFVESSFFFCEVVLVLVAGLPPLVLRFLVLF